MEKESKIINFIPSSEQFGNSLKRSAWTSIIESIFILLIGILIVIEPSWTLRITSYLIGGILSVRGLYQIINYFIEKGYNNFFNNNLLSGIIALLVGIFFLFSGETLLGIFRIIIGILILYSALARINLSIKLHSASVKHWYIPLLLSLISLVLSAFLLFNVNSAIILAGWFTIACGLLSLISDIFYIQDLNTIISFFTKKQ